jgi:hypothetical protein
MISDTNIKYMITNVYFKKYNKINHAIYYINKNHNIMYLMADESFCSVYDNGNINDRKYFDTCNDAFLAIKQLQRKTKLDYYLK